MAAVTSKLSEKLHPVEVVVEPTRANGLSVPSSVELGQIRSMNKQRLLKRIGALDAETMRKVDEALWISVGLADI